MSTEAPDPRTFKSWEDAFQYPIPAVRGMEKKLRSNIEDNHQKLRTLVGASYRDLLGTARTIIEVDAQMVDIEGLLQHAGKKSDSRIFEKLGSNHSSLERSGRAAVDQRLAFTSQFSVLQRCLDVVARLLKIDATVLLSAKLLVIARLLHKTLSEEPDQSPLLKKNGNRIAFLRQKLLRHVDRRLSRPNVDVAVLVEDMTAFALATSSSPTDVLRHFQHLRLEAIGRPFRQDRDTVRASISRRIQLFLGTLKDSRTCFPELFAASAKALAARALLDDDTVRFTDELDLDIHARWFAPEVQNFTPWTRHDELQRNKVDELLHSWTRAALKVLPTQVRIDVESETDIKSLAVVRRDVIQMWLSSKPNSPEVSSRMVLEQLRQPFVQRFNELVDDTFTTLRESMCRSIEDTLQVWDANQSSSGVESLWDPAMLSMDIRDGGQAFREAVIDRRLGRSKPLHAALALYESRARSIQSMREVVKEMQQTRWDYDLMDDDDDDDEDMSIQNELSRADPATIQASLSKSASICFAEMDSFLTKRIEEHPPDCSTASSAGVFTLRLIRELRQRVPALLRDLGHPPSQTPFAQTPVLALHSSLANAMFDKLHPAFAASVDAFVESKRPVRSLWSGSPALPVLPLPVTFKLLRATVKEMENVGTDLWSVDAVGKLKALLKARGAAIINDAVARVHRPPPRTGRGDDERQGEQGPVGDVVGSDKGDEVTADAGEMVGEDAREGVATMAEDRSQNQTDEAAAEPAAEPNDKQAAPEPPVSTHSNATDKTMQLLFDAIYLEQALFVRSVSTSSTNGVAVSEATGADGLGEVLSSLRERSELDDDALARLRRNATDYWKRSYLLFGLLAA